MASKSIRPRVPSGSNPYDYPGGRAPNVFDGMAVEQVTAEIDARVEKLFLERLGPRTLKIVGDAVSEFVSKALEGVMYYRGVYEDGTEYGPGSVVQHKGTIWVTGAVAATDRPGTSDQWRMLVKGAS